MKSSILRRLLSSHRDQITNALVRLAPMILKMGLAVYMARYFSLAELGIYGLVFGSVTVLTVIMGQDLIYVVSRDIVGADPATALHKMRDQAVLYGLNYLALIGVILFLVYTNGVDVSPRTMLYTLVLAILESLGTVTYFNMNSLHLQLRANVIFFIRSGLWTIPVIGLCALFPELRTNDTVLIGWIIGAAISLATTLWCWRDLPWRDVMGRKVNWPWIRRGIKMGAPIWLGMMGLTCGTFVDRFVVEHYLTVEDVGVLTFYFSFTNALLTLIYSGVASFTTPRMIKHHRDKAHTEFQEEVARAHKQVAFGAGIIAISLGITVPLLSYLMGRDVFVAHAGVFWLMLLGAWIQSNSSTFYNVLYARHQDKAIWLGNFLFLIPALGGNLLLVPILGFQGVGYSAVMASTLLLGWRWWHAKHFSPPQA